MKLHPPGVYPGLQIQAYPDLSTLGSNTRRLCGMGRRDRVLMLSPAFCVTCFLLSLELIHILIGSFFDRQNVIICRKRRCTDRHAGKNLPRFSPDIQFLDQVSVTCFRIRVFIEQNAEFIPADPVAKAVFRIRLFDAVGDLFQALVSRQVTVMIIDLFKIIDVKNHQRPAL